MHEGRCGVRREVDLSVPLSNVWTGRADEADFHSHGHCAFVCPKHAPVAGHCLLLSFTDACLKCKH